VTASGASNIRNSSVSGDIRAVLFLLGKIRAVAEQYRQFLLRKQFGTEKTAGYMQTWVEQFLYFACNHREEPFEQVLVRFEDALEAKGSVEAWQIKQANDAITLYHFHFRRHKNDDQRSNPRSRRADR